MITRPATWGAVLDSLARLASHSQRVRVLTLQLFQQPWPLVSVDRCAHWISAVWVEGGDSSYVSVISLVKLSLPSRPPTSVGIVVPRSADGSPVALYLACTSLGTHACCSTKVMWPRASDIRRWCPMGPQPGSVMCASDDYPLILNAACSPPQIRTTGRGGSDAAVGRKVCRQTRPRLQVGMAGMPAGRPSPSLPDTHGTAVRTEFSASNPQALSLRVTPTTRRISRIPA